MAAYVLAASLKNSTLSIEAGTKYFVMSSFSTILLLAGVVIIYASTGTLSFTVLQSFLIFNPLSFATIFAGFIFIFCGLYFKLGLFPFHNWIPDVYQGIPSHVVLVFSVLPKLPFFLLFAALFQQLIHFDHINIFICFC